MRHQGAVVAGIGEGVAAWRTFLIVEQQYGTIAVDMRDWREHVWGKDIVEQGILTAPSVVIQA